MKNIYRVLLFVALSAPGAASAKVNCDAFEGSWSGQMEHKGGDFNGATSMEIRNCKVTWTLPGGRKNSCRLRARKGKVEYGPCSLGSHGVVTKQAGTLTFQNVYTAARHRAYTVKLTRAK